MLRSVVAWCMPRIYPKAMKGRMIDFSDELWEAVRVDAEAAKMSRGAFIRQAVSDALRPIGGLVTDSDDPKDYFPAPKWQPPIQPLYDFPPVLEVPDDDDRETVIVVRCPHPKASRRQLSYGTFCDACQDMVR